LAFSDVEDGSVEDEEVESRGFVVDVPEVEFDFVFVGDCAAAVDLGPSCEAWFYVATTFLVIGPLLVLPGEERSGTDECHLTFKDVDQLGEFVEAVFSEPPADACDTRVLLVFRGKSVGVGIGSHGSEFIEGKDGSVFTDSILSEDGGSG